MARATFTYYHTSELSMDFKTRAFSYKLERAVESKRRPDGEIITIDKGYAQRTFIISSILSGTDFDTLDGWLTGSITYTAGYPKISTIHLSTSATLDNIEVYIPTMQGNDMGTGRWYVTITFVEKTT